MAAAKKKPTRELRAQEAEEAERKIDDAAGHIFMVLDLIDEEANPALCSDWRRLQQDLQALAERARKLAC